MESFVVAHYQQQIDALHTLHGADHPLAQLLGHFQADENHHQNDAHERTDGPIHPDERLCFNGSIAARAVP